MSNKERRKAPVLRFKGFTDDWEQCKLKDLFKEQITNGIINNPGKNELNVKDINVINLYNGDSINIKDLNYINVSESKLKKYQVRKGDIFLTRSSLKKEGIAKSNILMADSGNYVFDDHVMRLRFSNKVIPYFMNQLLFTSKVRAQFISKAKTGSMTTIGHNDINKTIVNLPTSTSEQKSVATILRNINHLIYLQQRKLEYYRKLKKRLSNKVFSTENYGATVTLGKIFNTVTDYVANGSFKSLRENVKTYSNKNYAYLIRLQDASNNWQGPWLYTDKKGYDFLKKSKLRPGDIIMANVGSVGKVFQVPDLSYPMTLAPNAILLRSKAANNAFLFEFLRSDYGQNLVRKMTTPGVQNKINKTDFKKITIRLPKKEIQDKWASLFESLNQIELGQLSSISNLKEIKKFLLQNMFI